MKILKTTAIVASIVFVLALVAGISLATVGFKNGYGDFIDVLDNSSNTNTVNEDKSLSADADGMTDLAIKIGAAKVSLVRENRTDVEVDYTSQVIGIGSNPVTAERSGNTVNVESKYDHSHRFPFFRDMHMTIRIPQNYNGNLSLDVGAGSLDVTGQQTYKAVSLTVGAGSISVDNLQAQSLNTKVSVGKFHADQVDVPDLTLNVSAGSADLSGSIGKTNLTMNMGSADLTYTRLSGDITATVSMGDAHIRLPSDVKATLNLNSSMGSVSQDFASRFSGDSGNNHVNGTLNGGGNTITGQVDMGSLSVGF